MVTFDALETRSIAVLGRFFLCLDLASRSDLPQLIAELGNSSSLDQSGSGVSVPSELPPQPQTQPLPDSELPRVLYREWVDTPKQSHYQTLISNLDLNTRIGLLKIDLRDLYALAGKGFISYEQAEMYRLSPDTINRDEQTIGGRQLQVHDLIAYLNDLALLRLISTTTANCYRKWTAGLLDRIGFGGAEDVRRWLTPYSKPYYAMLFGFLDLQNENAETNESTDINMGSFTLSSLQQMDLFDTPSRTSNQAATGAEAIAELQDAQKGDTQRKLEKEKVSEYAYISKTAWEVFASELMAMNRSGSAPRYKYGQIAAALFQCSLMTGLRHTEWFDAVLHENGFTDSHVTGIHLAVPVLQVFSVKQGNRRTDNPLRDYRLLVLEGFTPDHIAGIRNTLIVVQDMATEQDRSTIMSNVRMQLNRVWKKLQNENRIKETQQMPTEAKYNSVSMHTARKSFAEEVRRSMQYTRFDLAAMLGHTTLMNLKYYAKAKRLLPRTHAFPLPQPWPGEALHIEDWNQNITNYLHGSDVNRKYQELAAQRGFGGRHAATNWDDTLKY